MTMGRPPSDDPRSEYLKVRLTVGELERLRSDAAHEEVSGYVRRKLFGGRRPRKPKPATE